MVRARLFLCSLSCLLEKKIQKYKKYQKKNQTFLLWWLSTESMACGDSVGERSPPAPEERRVGVQELKRPDLSALQSRELMPIEIHNDQFQVLLAPLAHPTDAYRNKKYFCVCSRTTVSLKAGQFVLACPLFWGISSLANPLLSESLRISDPVRHSEGRSIQYTVFYTPSLQPLIMKGHNHSLT